MKSTKISDLYRECISLINEDKGDWVLEAIGRSIGTDRVQIHIKHPERNEVRIIEIKAKLTAEHVI